MTDFTRFKRPSGISLIVPTGTMARRWLMIDMGILDAAGGSGASILDDAKVAMEVKPEHLASVLKRLEEAGMVVTETGKA